MHPDIEKFWTSRGYFITKEINNSSNPVSIMWHMAHHDKYGSMWMARTIHNETMYRLRPQDPLSSEGDTLRLIKLKAFW